MHAHFSYALVYNRNIGLWLGDVRLRNRVEVVPVAYRPSFISGKWADAKSVYTRPACECEKSSKTDVARSKKPHHCKINQHCYGTLQKFWIILQHWIALCYKGDMLSPVLYIHPVHSTVLYVSDPRDSDDTTASQTDWNFHFTETTRKLYRFSLRLTSVVLRPMRYCLYHQCKDRQNALWAEDIF